MTKNRYFHYTIARYIDEIIESGRINVDLPMYSGQHQVAWVSANQEWENTVKKTSFKTLLGLKKHAEWLGAFRIEFNPDLLHLHPWEEFKKLERRTYVKGLERGARNWNAHPAEWFYCDGPIPVNAETVLSVGEYLNNSWLELPFHEFKDKRSKLSSGERDPYSKLLLSGFNPDSLTEHTREQRSADADTLSRLGLDPNEIPEDQHAFLVAQITQRLSAMQMLSGKALSQPVKLEIQVINGLAMLI
jgi:hypothetical protein